MHRQRTLITLAAAAALVLAGCGDDDTPTSQKDLQAFMDAADAKCNNWSPGFDEFLGQHPEPTAADYAAFLPSQVDGMKGVMDCIDAEKAPKELAAGVDRVVAQGRVVLGDLQQALDKAQADDLDGVNAALSHMNEVDLPKMGQLEDEIGAIIEAAGS